MAISPTQSLNYFDSLPDEKVLEIASYLSIEDVGRFAQVCKRFNTISNDDQFWKSIAEREGIETVDPNLSLSVEVKTYLNIKGKGEGNDFHSVFARTLGPTKYVHLPVLAYSEKRDYVDCIKATDMSAPIMKGTDPFNRPFVAFRYINRVHFTPNEQKVFAAFKRSSNNSSKRISSGTSYQDSTFDTADNELIRRISQLINNRPIWSYSKEVHKLDNGQYALELV